MYMMAKHQFAFVLCVCFINLVSSECIVRPPISTQTISETDKPGFYLFNLTLDNDVWSFNIKSPSTEDDFFRSYFNFDLHNDTFIFTVNKTLDLEDIYNQTNKVLNSFTFEFICIPNDNPNSQLVYDYFLRVEEVNEFPPNFINPPFVRNIAEDSVVDTELIVLSKLAEDADVNQTMNEIHGFKIHDYQNSQLDGQHKFDMPRSQDGLIRLNSPLDFENMVEKHYILNVSVQDRGGLTDFTLITVNVLDVDDLPPEFYYDGCQTNPCSIFYQTALNDDFLGEIINLSPADIFARDRDTLDYPVRYSIVNGDIPDVKDYFVIDDVTGIVTVVQSLKDVNVNSFSLTIEAAEESVNRRSTSTFLWITILGTSSSSASTQPQPTQVTQLLQTEDATLKITMIVLAVVIFLIIIAFIISILFVRKKYKKPVSPLDLSPSGSEIGTEDEELSISGSDNWPSPIPPGKQERIIASLPEGRGSLPPIQYVETGSESPSQYQQNLTHATLHRSGSKRSRKREKNVEFDIYDGTREYEGSADIEFYTREKSKIKLSSKGRDTDLDPKYWITIANDY